MIGVFSNVVFKIGPIEITDVVITTWGIMLFLAVISFIATRKLSLWQPGKGQIILEALIEAISNSIRSYIGGNPWPFVPLIGSMWIFIGSMNLINIIPHLHNPTRDLSTTSSLAFISFTAVHYYGIKHNGFKGYLRHYTEPVFFLAPFNIFSELSRTLAMAIRLFGNMLSWEMIVAILLLLVGFLVPIPLILLSIVGDVIQAYLFGALTLVFIAGSIRTTHLESFIEEE